MPRVRPEVRPLYSLYSANAISYAGNVLTALAIPWFVLSSTGSASKTGQVAAFGMIPVIIAGVFGGTLVDRFGFKRCSIAADLASGTTVAAIALCHALGVLSFPLLLILVFAGALLDAPGQTSRSALVPNLAAMAGETIDRASATLQAVERGSRLVAAPIAGLLIALTGAVGLLWIDAVTFAISAFLVLVFVPRQAKPAALEVSGGYWVDMRAGFAFIRGQAIVIAIVATVMLTNGIDATKGSVTMPVLAKDVFHSSFALGLMFAASGGGAVLGAILYARYGSRRSRRNIFIGGFVIASIPMIIFAFLPPLWLVLLLQVIGGIAAGPLNPIIYAIWFDRVPEAMRGRVFGTISSAALLAVPLGVLIGGLLVDWIGLPWTFAITGGIQLLVVLSLLINPAIREMDSYGTPGPIAPHPVA